MILSQAIENVMKARAAIVADLGPAKTGSGEIECPVCPAGKLRYRRATNGHIHAACSSDGCVRWME